MAADFSLKIMQFKRERSNIFKVMKEKKKSTWILYPEKKMSKTMAK